MTDQDVPRRWDVLSAPPHLHPGCRLLRRTIVKLDGVPQRRVRAWDCDAGTVTRIVTDRHGRVKINRTKRQVVTETVRGTVTVELQEEANA